ncbi:uncharacterized protein F4812DRAFT_321226 [Daldinia caldariorum]|uniref:uncharacterized protein n=1 Tax=Daldinia caldariorum TaxID=326644 RepID=UPI00200879C7|nr:uncharacterized protein F4812DRAFT_321226 [Daldinia caldariorum]KAI1469186.1 hypothetical protein F4812DRAFT_321226 [Daldinia caldariorum]
MRRPTWCPGDIDIIVISDSKAISNAVIHIDGTVGPTERPDHVPGCTCELCTSYYHPSNYFLRGTHVQLELSGEINFQRTISESNSSPRTQQELNSGCRSFTEDSGAYQLPKEQVNMII